MSDPRMVDSPVLGPIVLDPPYILDQPPAVYVFLVDPDLRKWWCDWLTSIGIVVLP